MTRGVFLGHGGKGRRRMRATREGRLAKNERTCHQCKLQVDLKRSWPSEATHTLAETSGTRQIQHTTTGQRESMAN